MSTSGVWALLVATDEDLAPFAGPFAARLAARAASPEVAARLAGWAAAPELVKGYEPEPDGRTMRLNRPSQAFQALGAVHPVADASAPVTRKVDPMAALFRAAPYRRLAGPGDTGQEPDELLDAIPALWDRAARLGLGVCSTTETV